MFIFYVYNKYCSRLNTNLTFCHFHLHISTRAFCLKQVILQEILRQNWTQIFTAGEVFFGRARIPDPILVPMIRATAPAIVPFFLETFTPSSSFSNLNVKIMLLFLNTHFLSSLILQACEFDSFHWTFWKLHNWKIQAFLTIMRWKQMEMVQSSYFVELKQYVMMSWWWNLCCNFGSLCVVAWWWGEDEICILNLL